MRKPVAPAITTPKKHTARLEGGAHVAHGGFGELRVLLELAREVAQPLALQLGRMEVAVGEPVVPARRPP